MLTIPYTYPTKFIPQIVAGTVSRSGAVLTNTATGQIVGHMKEAGKLAQTLSGISPMDLVSKGVQHYQLQHIQKTLNSLQMISTVGAAASVATLGVSVAGFAVVLKKLNHLDSKLDQVLCELRSIKTGVKLANIKLDAISISRLTSAGEHLQHAQEAIDPQRRKDLLTRACELFTEQKHYYATLLEIQNPWMDPHLSIRNSTELYSRFVVCCTGQLQAEFLLGDWGACKSTWETVNEQVAKAGRFDKKTIYRTRTDATEGIFDKVEMDKAALANEIKTASAITCETHARVNSMIVEIDYMERNELDPFEYLLSLREAEDDIVMIPACNK